MADIVKKKAVSREAPMFIISMSREAFFSIPEGGEKKKYRIF